MSTLNKRATEAIASVQFSSHVMLSAVEEREKELFRQITEVRQWKYDALHEKYANLKGDQARLADAVHALKYVLQEMRSHPSEILKMKDRVLAEVTFSLFLSRVYALKAVYIGMCDVYLIHLRSIKRAIKFVIADYCWNF